MRKGGMPQVMHGMNFVHFQKPLTPCLCNIPKSPPPPLVQFPNDFVVQTQYINRFCYVAKKMRLDESF